MRLKILFIAPYPSNHVASQRFRFEQYSSILNKKYDCETHSFYSIRTFSILYKKGHFTGKLIGFLSGYIKRLLLVTKINNFDLIFLHRQATTLGPPFIEWIIARVYKKPIIYDFDDAIWMPDSPNEKWWITFLKCPWKVKYICRWSSKISCGNSFLHKFASKYNKNAHIIPTTIDTKNYHIPVQTSNISPVIGWTGTQSTLPYLASIVPILQDLQQQFGFVFKVICNKKPDFYFKGLQYIPWNKESEIQDLNAIDIGIMPLPDTPWTHGKCGFKILQYMALEKAAVASPVGVNQQIIDHGVNGLFCQKEQDWFDNLKLLITKRDLRLRLGKNARSTVKSNYSTNSNTKQYLDLFTC